MKEAISLMGRSEIVFGMTSNTLYQLPSKPSRQEEFEDLVMNFLLDQEEKVRQLEEYITKKIKKIIRYPDTEDLEPLNDHKFSETLTKEVSSHTPKTISPKSLYVKHVRRIFPSPPLVRESTFGFKSGTKNNRNIKYRHDVENLSRQSTPQVLSSFEEYTPSVTYLEEAEETLGTPIVVEPLNETQLKDLGLNTCNDDIPLSSRKVSNFDEPKPQPQPLRNCPSLDVSLGDERGSEPPIKPHSPNSCRMKVVDNLTIHTPPSPHVASFHLKDMYCYYHPCIDDLKKQYGFKPGLLGHSRSLGVDFSNMEMIKNDWELESKEVSFLGRGLNLLVWPKEVEKVRVKETHHLDHIIQQPISQHVTPSHNNECGITSLSGYSFGDIPTVIPSTSVVAPKTSTIAPDIAFAAPVVETTLVASPTRLCVLVPYSGSDSDSPNEMSSLEHISPLPAISPFLCTDSSEALDSSDGPPSQDPYVATVACWRSRVTARPSSSYEFPIAPVTAPPGIRRRPRKLLTVRKRVGPLPVRRLASRRGEDAEVGPIKTGVDMELGIGDGDNVRDHVEIDPRDARDDTEEYEADTSAGDTAEVGVHPMSAPIVKEEIVEPAREDSFDSSGIRDGIVRSFEDMPINLDDAMRDFYHHMSERVSIIKRIDSLRLENLKVRAMLDIERDRVNSLRLHMSLSQEEFRQVRRDRDDTRGRLRRTMTNTRSGMTPAAIEEMINQRVDAALEARRVNRDLELGNGNDNGGDGNGDGNGNGTGNGNNGGDNGDGNENRNVNGRGDRPVAHECTYQDFMKCQPLSFKGTEGVVGLIRWSKKMETVFHISNCPERYQVKELLKLMTKVYCSRNEIQKMETKL
ncbi:hypothetical protein Tco_0530347 [Tanacetum coccineum]